MIAEREKIGAHHAADREKIDVVDPVADLLAVACECREIEGLPGRCGDIEAKRNRVLFEDNPAGHAQFAANDVVQACRKDDQASPNARSIGQQNVLKIFACRDVGYRSDEEVDRTRQSGTHGVDQVMIKEPHVSAVGLVDNAAMPRIDDFVEGCRDGKGAVEQAQALQHAHLRPCYFLRAKFQRMLCMTVEERNPIALSAENGGRERSAQAPADNCNIDFARRC
jgi:hypothetical protein